MQGTEIHLCTVLITRSVETTNFRLSLFTKTLEEEKRKARDRGMEERAKQSLLFSVMIYVGKESKNSGGMCIPESLCCTVETSNVLNQL